MTTETEPTQSLPVQETKSDYESDRSNSESLQKKQYEPIVSKDEIGLVHEVLDLLEELLVNAEQENNKRTQEIVTKALKKCGTTIDKMEERKKRGPKKSIDKKVSETPTKEKPKEITDDERDALRCEWAGMND